MRFAGWRQAARAAARPLLLAPPASWAPGRRSGSIVGPWLRARNRAGMLEAARGAAIGARVLRGDAAHLPLADGCADVALAPHMLYHVPDRLAAISELRRITGAGGRVLVVLNGPDQMRYLVSGDIGPALAEGCAEQLRLDEGEKMLTSVFGPVERRRTRTDRQLASGRVHPQHDPGPGTARPRRRHGVGGAGDPVRARRGIPGTYSLRLPDRRLIDAICWSRRRSRVDVRQEGSRSEPRPSRRRVPRRLRAPGCASA